MTTKPPSILLADDDQQQLIHLVNCLSEARQDYKLLSAVDGQQACIIAQKELPDLILLDWDMPVMSGLEAARLLKQQSQTAHIPIIIISGVLNDSDDLENLLAIGVIDFIQKPVQALELLARVNAVLRLSLAYQNVSQQNKRLTHSEELYFHLLEASPDAILITTTKGVITHASPKTAELFGLSNHQLVIDKQLYNLFAKNACQTIEKAVQSLIQGKHNELSQEYMLKKADGSLFYGEVRSTALRHEEQQLKALIFIIRDITLRKQQEHELHDSQNNLKALINNTEDFVWSIDKQYRLVTINSSMKKAFNNLNITIKKGDDALKKMRPEYRASWKVFYDKTLSGQQFSTEFNVHNPNRVYELSCNPIFSDQQKIVGAAFFARNISEKKQDAKELAMRERYLEAIVNVQWYFMIFDEDKTHYLRILKVLGEVSGADRAYIAKNRAQEDEPLSFEVTREWTTDGVERSYIGEKQRFYKDGFPRWEKILSRERVINSALKNLPKEEREILKQQGTQAILLIPLLLNDRFFGFIGFDSCKENKEWTNIEVNLLRSAATSISLFEEKRLSKQVLAQSEERLRAFFNNAVVGIGITNAHKQYTMANDTWCKMLAYEPHQVYKLTIEDIIHPADKQAFAQQIELLSKGEIHELNIEQRFLRRNNSILWVNLSVSSVRTSDNQLQSILCFAVDIDEQKRNQLELNSKYKELDDLNKKMQREIAKRKVVEVELKNAKEAAEAANRAKSIFLANMSHEIRTPMNAVLGFTELLTEMITDKQQKAYLESIRSSGRNLLQLINDILDLSKIEAGKLDLQYNFISLLPIVEEMHQIFSLKLSQKQLKFVTEFAPDIPPRLYLDEVRMRQILLNLIGNAIKFTDNGYVKITVDWAGTNTDAETFDLRIAIEDTGIGIPEHSQQAIFDAFRQQDEQDTKRYGGTGLGLSITKRLVEMMQGSLSLHSKINEGSCFEIILPNVQYENEAEIRPAVLGNEATSIVFDPAGLLLVDDIESNRLYIKAAFKETDIRVYEAENGMKAISMAKQVIPQLILMDLRMPVMNGYEASGVLKNDPLLKHIPIVALTASVMNTDQDKIKQSLFDAYLMKPIQKIDLFETLAQFLPHQYEKITKHAETDELNLNGNITLSENSLSLLPEIINTLEKKLAPLWQSAQKGSITDIRQFAEEIKRIGEKYTIDLLLHYAHTVYLQLDSFDIEKLDITIKRYSELIECLQAAGKNK